MGTENGMSYREQIVGSKDGYQLHLHAFENPQGKAVVLCIHGMEEHQDRYIPFATFLQENGYAVVTANMRGHGKDAPVLSHIADRDGDRLLIEDEEAILSWIRKEYPEMPVILFGHSMGTIIARAWLRTSSGAFRKAVLSGYPNPQAAAKAGVHLTHMLKGIKGADGHSKLVDNMVLGGFSKAVEGAETPLDWLSRDRENVRAYQADPLCGVPFTLGSYEALFRLIMAIDQPEGYRQVQENLPILLIAGEEDPCVGGEKGRADSLDRLTKAGFRNIEVRNMEGMRHEILNETNRMQAWQYILDFLNRE